MQWPEYMPYQPVVGGLPHELDRASAQKRFDDIMVHKAERVAQLGKVVEANGFRLGSDDDSLDALDDFFRTNVEPSASDPSRMMNIWYAMAFDIALHLGDVIIERAPSLRWDFFRWGPTGPGRDMSYHQPVIMGYSGTEPLLSRELIVTVSWYGVECMGGEVDEAGYFKQIVTYDVANA